MVYYIRHGNSRRFAKAGEGEFKALLRRLGYLLGELPVRGSGKTFPRALIQDAPVAPHTKRQKNGARIV